MDWLTKMNRALDYIESNLTNDIDIAKAAQLACCSSFNFQRMFSFAADVSIADYIRHRRLSMAAFDLQQTNDKVIDIALKYGYESPVSFARAFSAIHGITPNEARKQGAKIKAYPKISFEITVKGVTAMNYRIEEFGELRLVGYKRRFSLKNDECFNNIPAFWGEMSSNGSCEKMMQYNTNQDLCCLGVCTEGDGKEFDYFIATGSDKEIPDSMDELIVPANTYVIFECKGKMPDGQQNVWKRVFTEWFPNSGYELVNSPQIEWYGDGDMSSDDYYSEIWLPIRKV